ncbi:Kelch-like protein 21 [Ilyonectria robusta]
MISTRTAKQIAEARENGKFTDFEFTCEGHTIPVHRVIICSQSPVLRAACTGEFKEASTRTYSLDSHSLPMVRRMVDFFYTGDYAEESEEEDTAKKYSENLTKNPDVSNFLLSISEVYNSTPTSSRGLRDHALAFAREKLPGFLTSLDAKERFDEVTADTPEFIKDLLYSFMHYPLMGYCDNCGSSKPVPVEPLQCRCKQCGKGGAGMKRRKFWLGVSCSTTSS